MLIPEFGWFGESFWFFRSCPQRVVGGFDVGVSFSGRVGSRLGGVCVRPHAFFF